MRMKGVFVLASMALVLSGCGKTYPPSSGGRTASYWAEVLEQPDLEQRRKAAAKLGPLVLIDKAAMPALVAALKDTDVQVRSAAVRSLGIYTGARGREVLPALRELEQQDADATVREAAAKAVQRLSKS
jgi:HEAT repeat protein